MGKAKQALQRSHLVLLLDLGDVGLGWHGLAPEPPQPSLSWGVALSKQRDEGSSATWCRDINMASKVAERVTTATERAFGVTVMWD